MAAKMKNPPSEYNYNALPHWARRHKEVVELCSRDYAFFCLVCSEKNYTNRRKLIAQAKGAAQ